MTTIPQLNDIKRRKSELALKAARYGINAAPEVSIEINDLETVIGLMERVDIHRSRLSVLLTQRDHFGMNVPPHIVNQISTERSQIMTLRNQLTRLRYPIGDHEVDDDQPATTPIAMPQPDRLTRIEQKLDRVLQLLEDQS